MTKPAPIRMTDEDVRELMIYGAEHPIGAAALSRLVQRMGAYIDDRAAEYAYGQMATSRGLLAQPDKGE